MGLKKTKEGKVALENYKGVQKLNDLPVGATVTIDVSAMLGYATSITTYHSVHALVIDYMKKIVDAQPSDPPSVIVAFDDASRSHPFRDEVHAYRTANKQVKNDNAQTVNYGGTTYRVSPTSYIISNDTMDRLRLRGEICQQETDHAYRAHPAWHKCIMTAVQHTMPDVIRELSEMYTRTVFMSNNMAWKNGNIDTRSILPFGEADLMLLSETDSTTIYTVDWDLLFVALLADRTHVTTLCLSKQRYRITPADAVRPWDWSLLVYCLFKHDYCLRDGSPTSLVTAGYSENLFLSVMCNAFPDMNAIVEDVPGHQITFNVHVFAEYFRLMDPYRRRTPSNDELSSAKESMSKTDFDRFKRSGIKPFAHAYLSRVNCNAWHGRNDGEYSVLHHIIERAIWTVIYFARLRDANNAFTNFPIVRLPSWTFTTVQQFHENTSPLVYTYTYPAYYPTLASYLHSHGINRLDVDDELFIKAVHKVDATITLRTNITNVLVHKLNECIPIKLFELGWTGYVALDMLRYSVKGVTVPPCCNTESFLTMLKMIASSRCLQSFEMQPNQLTPHLVAEINIELSRMAPDMLCIRNRHPRDDNIVFYDVHPTSQYSHVYYVNNTAVLVDGNPFSATALKSVVTDSRPSAFIEHHMSLKKRQTDYTLPNGTLMSSDAILKAWAAKGEWSSNYGTQMHYLIELYHNKRPPEPCLHKGTRFDQEVVLNQYIRHYSHLDHSIYRTEWSIYADVPCPRHSGDDSTVHICGQIDEVWMRVKDGVTQYYIKDTKIILDIEKAFGRYADFEFMSDIRKSKQSQYSVQLHIYRWILLNAYGDVFNETNLPVHNLILVPGHYNRTDVEEIVALDVSEQVNTMFAMLPELLAHRKRVSALLPSADHSDYKFHPADLVVVKKRRLNTPNENTESVGVGVVN